MRHVLVLLLITLALAGCASKKSLSCDGNARRPVGAQQQVGVIYPSCGIAA